MKKLLLISLVIFFTICSRSWTDDVNNIKFEVDLDFLKPGIIHVEPINEAIERAKKQKSKDISKDINKDIDKDINKKIYEGLDYLTPPNNIHSPGYLEKNSKWIIPFSVFLFFGIHRAFFTDRKQDGKTWYQEILDAKKKKKEQKNNIKVINQMNKITAGFLTFFICMFFLFFFLATMFFITEGFPVGGYQFEKDIDGCISDGATRKDKIGSHYYMADYFKEQCEILEPGKSKNRCLESSINYIERAKKLEKMSDLDYCVKEYYKIILYSKTYNYKIYNFILKRDIDYWNNIIIEKYYK